MVIDAQLHEPGPHLEWPEEDGEARDRVMTEIALAWMESLGVDRALLHPSHPGWADYAVSQAPEKFATVPMFPPLEEPEGSLPELLALYRERNPNLKAIRLTVGYPPTGETARAIEDGQFDDLLKTCESEALPVFIFATHFLSSVPPLAERFPGLTFVLDHIGIPQPPMDQAESPKWKLLPEVVALARFPNLALKLCGAPALSEEGPPFADLWPHLGQIIEAFGADRCMWASDQSRFYGRIGMHMTLPDAIAGYPGKHDYSESIGLYRDTEQLSEAEKSLILGGTVEKLLGWK